MSLKPNYSSPSGRIAKLAPRLLKRPYLRLATNSRLHEESIVVLKVGGSALRKDLSLTTIVSEIYQHVRDGHKVFAVISALPGCTEQLIESARQRFDDPDPGCLAALLATGESSSTALLGMALEQAGIPAAVLDPAQVNFIVSGPPLDADPTDLNCRKIRRLLEKYSVVVFPGFFGRDVSGSISLLGRGGSDYTALFAAHRLDAKLCCLLKDVNGIFPKDPNAGKDSSAGFSHIAWEEILHLTDRAVQPKAVRFAKDNELQFTVRAPLSRGGTVVGCESATKGSWQPPARPLRIALLGLGNVGLGVYRHLLNHCDRFQITGIAVKNLQKERHSSVPVNLLTDDPWSLVREPADIIVELIGGCEPAAGLIKTALERGSHVVTANKAVVARELFKLEGVAASRGVQLCYSASVGGAVPMLETVRRIAQRHRVEAITGVINGTCNFVLDRLAGGVGFPEAMREAQEKGYAEADPQTDLNGADSADKLAILTQAAFNVRLAPEEIECRGIEGLDSCYVRSARMKARVVRLVASCRRTSKGVRARVKPIALRSNHPLAHAAGSENRLLLEVHDRSPILLSGKGAGRWPTSLAVLADLLDLYSSSSAQYIAGEEMEPNG